MNADLRTPLSDEELDELEDFLISDATSDETMDLEILDGFLTAISAGPVTIPPSQWLPRVWGPTQEHAPEFESKEEAQRIMDLILRHMNGVIGSLDADPDAFEPMMSTRTDPRDRCEYLDGEWWAHGFMDGVALCRKEWQPLFNDTTCCEAIRPLHLLGANELTDEEQLLVKTPAQREELSRSIRASVAAIYRFWLPYREAEYEAMRASRAARKTKTGRNDPCPCGSGKKFKKCCGAHPGTTSSMH